MRSLLLRRQLSGVSLVDSHKGAAPPELRVRWTVGAQLGSLELCDIWLDEHEFEKIQRLMGKDLIWQTKFCGLHQLLSPRRQCEARTRTVVDYMRQPEGRFGVEPICASPTPRSPHRRISTGHRATSSPPRVSWRTLTSHTRC